METVKVMVSNPTFAVNVEAELFLASGVLKFAPNAEGRVDWSSLSFERSAGKTIWTQDSVVKIEPAKELVTASRGKNSGGKKLKS